MVEKIENNEQLLAIIVYSSFQKEGVHFFTDDTLSQQLAYMKHKKGRLIDPHIHRPVPRQVEFTQETLFIRSGKLRVDFYNDEQNYLCSRELSAGDVILLVKGGHGFEVLEDLEMFEVKQGPYAGDKDKIRFAFNKELINQNIR